MPTFKIHYSFTERDIIISLQTTSIKAETLDEALLYLSEKYKEFKLIKYSECEVKVDKPKESIAIEENAPTKLNEIKKTLNRYKLLKGSSFKTGFKELDRKSKFVFFVAIFVILFLTIVIFANSVPPYFEF